MASALARRRSFTLFFLLIAIAGPPVLLATWGFERALVASETGRLDLQVSQALASTESTVRLRADRAGAAAAALARSPRLQQALRRRDRPELLRLVAAHPGTEIVLPDGVSVGSLPAAPRELGRVDVGAGAARIGSVVSGASFVPTAGRLGGVTIAVTVRGRIVAGPNRGARLSASSNAADAHVGGRVYRAEAVDAAGGQVVGLADRGPTDAAVAHRRNLILLAALATLVSAALGVTLLVGGRRRRADRTRSAGAVTLVENLLGAVQDPDAMLGVVLQSAVAVTGAAGGSLSWRGETVHHGARADDRGALNIELLDDEGVAVGQLALVAEEEPFGRETEALVGTVVERGIAALEAVRRQRIVQYQALTDELTGLANRRRLRTVLELEVARADRSATPLSLIVADLDNFKQINDALGHAGGDRVLHAFAGLLAERIRATDVAARLGGDEFVVVLPDTPLPGAVALAENLRLALLDDEMPEALKGVTASFGAAVHISGSSAEGLLRTADEGLYAAKRAGRNRVVAAAAVE